MATATLAPPSEYGVHARAGFLLLCQDARVPVATSDVPRTPDRAEERRGLGRARGSAGARPAGALGSGGLRPSLPGGGGGQPPTSEAGFNWQASPGARSPRMHLELLEMTAVDEPHDQRRGQPGSLPRCSHPVGGGEGGTRLPGGAVAGRPGPAAPQGCAW